MVDIPIHGGARRNIFFDTLGVPHLYSLNRVELLTSTMPIDPHVHRDSFEICVHYEGRQYYEIDGIGYETHAGDIFISAPNEHHSSGNRNEEKSRFYYLIFECMPDTRNFLGLENEAAEYIKHKLYSVESHIVKGATVVRPILDNIMKLYDSQHPLRRPKIQSLIVDFFYELCILIDRSLETTSTPPDIQHICDYIDSHITQTMPVSELAAMIFLSDSQFKRKFKQYMAYSPHDYIMRQKMNLAGDMLLYTYIPVTQIAYELGISSSQMFSKVFKKYTGKTPGQFRKNRNRELLDAYW